ncbi:hypothetical protein Back2_05780 [Nocardioides baekrokdamisoli]|uniref:DUF1697 domain-containing protein n=1 Tax=Nocardioides baekrokdamisoli TaxID=1804624 RepID=A0A3G9IRN8_9ACTN|nr:DUF1697 domain-containing protein [Nocardioides baekrokdamisoli]BBH16291.1 hypothetical protein Back2_05780 [Nocardioides baekrokdamisoli]
MTWFVALIRGIGPGDPRKSNESLRGVLEELGYGDVRSVISSGNVVFTSDETDADAIGDRLEAAWPELRGFTATTIVRSREQLAALVERLPFTEPHDRENYQLVTFFKRSQDRQDPPAGMAMRAVGMVDGALCTTSNPSDLKTPEAMRWLEKTYSKELTSRTPLTLARILKKME